MHAQFREAELAHYQRHFNLPEVGMAGQLRLRQAKVLVIGAGGLGSSALLYLAAAGVGTIGIVDDDCVEVSNLQRQVLYSYAELGSKKVFAAKERLTKLNPAICIVAHEMRLTHANALELVAQYDVIVDGSDNFATRYLVNDAGFHLKKPVVHASVTQFAGQCSVFFAEQSACYRCLFAAPPAPGMIPSCAEGGVLGVLPGIMGSIQATEVLKLILGIGKPLLNRLLMFDALTMQFREFALTKNPECRLCQRHESFANLPHHEEESCVVMSDENISVTELHALMQNKMRFTLLDVREQFEYEICNLGGKHIPLGMLAERINELDKNEKIVVHCKSGGRSMQALGLLRAHGFTQVVNLAGGILAWIEKVDPALAKY